MVDSDSGTPLYFAPEVLAGQPHTVRSDNYALGVLLYQLAVGDFKKPLSPGWERDIADPLLREDIALAADGNPQHRLGDAEELARRLRSLDSRREQRARRAAQQALEQSQREAAEKLRADNQQLRSRRRWQWLAIVALGIGLLAGLTLYRRAGLAQQQALEAADTAEAVSAFLADDLLAAANPARVDVRRLTVKALIDAAEQRVGPRFAANPLAEARVRRALATAYYSLGQTDSAFAQIRQAWRLLPGLLDRRSTQLPEVAAQLAQLPDAARSLDLPLWMQVLTTMQAQVGASDPRVLEVALFIGGIHFDRGNFDDCFRLLDQSLAAARTLRPRQALLESRIQHLLSRAYISVDRYPESIAASREALSLLRTPALAGGAERAIALQLHYLGRALRFYGQLPQAEQALEAAGATIFRNARDDSEPVTELRWELLELHLMQKRWALAESEANGLLSNIQGQFESGGDNRTLLFLLGARAALAGGQGDWAKAEGLAREQLAGFEALQRDLRRGIPRDRISIVVSTIGLMRALIEQGKTQEARAALDALDPADLRTVDIVPLNSVSLHRVLGLLALAEGQSALARQELNKARDTLSKLCAPEHPWFAELNAALERAGAGSHLMD
ncbi:tetratricopeptide repeat-containing protein kinase family protein [Stagnimonas aquatica]|uniref:tetratricopeptide repeat-containing protein kinase family protein n=1 Tax=Stagnimonas aquatica TaxID=2689987 RepID=UPI00131571D1|nr:tetratricopeptide repeat-containing protein kinase family protein [Stagnimonas aquatica]